MNTIAALERGSYWTEASVLMDTGHFSLVSGIYRDQGFRVGMRWNGEGGKLGHPQSRGNPTFFVLPHNFAVPVLMQAFQMDLKVVNRLSLLEALKKL
jgi:hypothetical protein